MMTLLRALVGIPRAESPIARVMGRAWAGALVGTALIVAGLVSELLERPGQGRSTSDLFDLAALVPKAFALWGLLRVATLFGSNGLYRNALGAYLVWVA